MEQVVMVLNIQQNFRNGNLVFEGRSELKRKGKGKKKPFSKLKGLE
jgi:hypothetical protein